MEVERTVGIKLHTDLKKVNNLSISQLIVKLPATQMYSAKEKQQQQPIAKRKNTHFSVNVCIKGNKFLTDLLLHGLDCSCLYAVDCMTVENQHILLQYHVLKAIISEKQNLATCLVVCPKQVNSGSCTECEIFEMKNNYHTA